MVIKFDEHLLNQVRELQEKREQIYTYPHNIRWLALAKNVGEAFNCYFRQDEHYIKELGDTIVNILMILEEKGVDLEDIINYSLQKTKESIETALRQEEK